MEDDLIKLNADICTLMMNRQSNNKLSSNLSNKDKNKLDICNKEICIKIDKLLKKGFSLCRIIEIKKYIKIISDNFNSNIDIDTIKLHKYQYKLVINFIEYKGLHFSIYCPIDIIKSKGTDNITTHFNILAEVMIVDDTIQKYYDRLDFGITEDHTYGNTFYIYEYSEIGKILIKLHNKIKTNINS